MPIEHSKLLTAHMIAETVVGSEVLDDWSSAWQECKDKGEKWGGRGKGGEAIEELGLHESITVPADMLWECKVWRVLCDAIASTYYS